jgi:hypothetical protein
MSYQIRFCPGCGTNRVVYGYRCSVCAGLVRRSPVRPHLERQVARRLLSWPSSEPSQAVPPERQPVAA